MSAPGSIIKIKRSPNVGAPATLAQGEMAYSYAAGGYNLLGDRLFIGTGSESGGNAADHSAIGGLYYTRLIDASVPGTLTTNANSVPVLNSSGKIDKWYAGNTYIYDNVITTTATNGNLSLDPNGTGMVKIAGTWTLPRSAGTNNYILKTDGSGTSTWAEPKVYIGTTAANIFNSSGDVTSLAGMSTISGTNAYNKLELGSGTVLSDLNGGAVQIKTGSGGTSSHTWSFNANGSTTLNGAYTLPAADGSSNYILKTNGTGAVTFAEPKIYIGTTAIDLFNTSGTTSSLAVDISGTAASATTAGSATFVTGLTAANVQGVIGSVSTASFPTLNQNTTGTAASATSATYVTGLTAANVQGVIGSVSTASFPTLNQNTTGQAGKVANALTAGTDLTLSSGSTYDGSAALTLNVSSTLDSVTGRGYTTTHGITVGNISVGTGGTIYKLPTADGAAGYIIKTYGNGIAYWSSATASQIQSDYTQTDTGAVDYIKNKPNLSVYALSSSLATVATSGSYNDLTGKPSLATVATSGAYGDLTGKPDLSVYALSSSLATVATSGSYNDLINKPVLAAYLNVLGDSGTGNVALLNDSIDFVGLGPVRTIVTRSGNIVSVSSNVAYATTSNVGVASFSSTNFAVDSAAQVTIKLAGISNNILANSNVVIGSTTVNLGTTVTAFSGLTSLQVGNIKIYSDNQITTQETNGNLNLFANGTGVIDVHSARISSVGTPTQPYDAATKNYVDAVASGLHVHSPAKVAVSGTLAILTGGTVTYNNGTAGVGATLTLQNAITTIDSMTFGTEFTSGDRILIKDQAATLQNGVYTISANGKVLTRATDFDSSSAVNGGDFIFVVEGTNYGSTGWVQTTDTVSIGTDPIVFSQFAGAGTYLAGTGLYLNGSTFNANVNSTSGGIEIVSNQFQLKSTLAGNGLTYTTGVLDIVGTSNRISVSSDAIDISAAYVGQTSITTLGAITAGTWTGNIVGTGYGGTGLSTYTAGDILYASATNILGKIAKGTDGQLLTMVSGSPTWATLDGGTY